MHPPPASLSLALIDWITRRLSLIARPCVRGSGGIVLQLIRGKMCGLGHEACVAASAVPLEAAWSGVALCAATMAPNAVAICAPLSVPLAPATCDASTCVCAVESPRRSCCVLCRGTLEASCMSCSSRFPSRLWSSPHSQTRSACRLSPQRSLPAVLYWLSLLSVNWLAVMALGDIAAVRKALLAAFAVAGTANPWLEICAVAGAEPCCVSLFPAAESCVLVCRVFCAASRKGLGNTGAACKTSCAVAAVAVCEEVCPGCCALARLTACADCVSVASAAASLLPSSRSELVAAIKVGSGSTGAGIGTVTIGAAWVPFAGGFEEVADDLP